MSGRAASVGCVPCTFQVQVHEAISVPPRCEKLRVAWRKGKKVVSTDLALVQAGHAKWEQDLSIDVMLFRVVRGSQVEVEAKECVLEVREDRDELVGHAKFDLAEFCTGTVQDRSIMVFRGGTQFVGNMRILVSISVGSSYLSMATRGVNLPRSLFKGVAEVHPTLGPEFMPDQPAFPPMAAPASGRTSRTLSEDHAPTPVMPGVHQPIDVLPAMTPIQSGLCSPVPVLPPELRSMPVLPEPASAYGATLTSLPARLVALCNRQCAMSKLSLMEQEDAVRMAFANLRQSYEVTSCGILFSNASKPRGTSSLTGNSQVSKLPVVADADKHVPGEGASDKVGDGVDAPSNSGDAVDVVHEPPDVATTTETETVSEGGAQDEDGQVSTIASLPCPVNLHLDSSVIPQSDIADTSAVAGDVVDAGAVVHACCRSVYELMSHLSDIQSLANTLNEAGLAKQLSVQTAEPIEPVEERKHRLSSEESIDSSQTDTPRQMSVVLSNNAAAFSAAAFSAAALSNESATQNVPQGHDLPSLNGSDQHAVIAQILQGVAQAVLLSRQVMEEVSLHVHELVLRLHEVAQDRELWVHRLLAHQELHRAWTLQELSARVTATCAANSSLA